MPPPGPQSNPAYYAGVGTALAAFGDALQGNPAAPAQAAGRLLSAIGVYMGGQGQAWSDAYNGKSAESIVGGFVAAVAAAYAVPFSALASANVGAAILLAANPVAAGILAAGFGFFVGLAAWNLGSFLTDKLVEFFDYILGDPIVLDLDGDGIELIALAGSAVLFDMDDDGVAERTGWVSPQDGLLVHDANANGLADGIGELFGSANVDGYDELATLDSNADGRIDASDAAFAELMVWRDLNGDGEATTDEMLTLAQAGIARFNLGFTQTDTDVDGNVIARTGTYVRTDSSTRAMGSVQFALDESGNIPAIPENAALGDLLILPNLSGNAALPDLRTAMFYDATLKAMVEDLVFGDHDFDTFAEFQEGGFLDMLYRWAGIDTSVPLEPGDQPYNFQLLAAFMGRPFDDLNAHQVQRVEDELWPQFIQQLGVQFLVQAAQGPAWQVLVGLSDGFAALDPQSPAFDADTAGLIEDALDAAASATPAHGYLDLFAGLSFDPATGGLAGDFDALVKAVLETQPSFYSVRGPGGGNGGGGEGGSVGIFIGEPDPSYDDRHPWTAWYEDEGSLLFTIADAMGIGSDYVLSATGWRWLSGEATRIHGTDGDNVIDQEITTFSRIVAASGPTGLYYTVIQIPTHDQLIFGYEGNDTLIGNDGVDRLVGGSGDDLLNGGTDSDMYVYASGDGEDVIVDAAGADDVIYFSSEFDSGDLQVERIGNHLRLHFGTAGEGITLTNQWLSAAGAIEQFHFVAEDGLDAGDIASLYLASLTTSGADTIAGSWAGERIDGADGADTLSGGAGNDMLNGGAGNDTLYGDGNDDVLSGGEGNDTLYGGDQEDVLTGGAGNDWLRGGGHKDTYVYALGDGDDTIQEPDSPDVWYADTIAFGDGITAATLLFARDPTNNANMIINFAGHAGSILILNQRYGDGGIEAIRFADGTIWSHAELSARYVFDQQTGGNDTIWGSEFGDSASGGGGNDLIETFDGADTLNGGAGADTLRGGTGNDTYVYLAGGGDDVIYDTGGSYDWTGTDTLIFGEGITAADLFLSRVTGDSTDIRITIAGSGSIVIDGQMWDDVGIEAVNFASGTVWTHAQFMARYVADQKTAGNDTIWGSNLDDVVDGGAGNDFLHGAGGADTYAYAIGDGNDLIGDNVGSEYWIKDVLAFGAGITADDLVFSRRPSDTQDLVISFRDHAGSIIVDGQFWDDWGIETIRFADDSTLTAAQFEALVVATQEGAGPIAGTAGNDSLWTMDGNDEVNGLAGDDLIGGGDGDDVIAGDTLTDDGGDTLHGGAGDDQLFGVGGDDTLHGGDGNDLIVGGAGVDALNGGTGADVFRFAAADSLLAAADTIADFMSGTDKIDLSQIDADTGMAGVQQFTFIGSGAFSATPGELRYGFNGTDTYLKADRDGDGAADLVVILSGAVTPLAADFIL
jgi:Ca2+-binding RTX toxin-like protein